MSVYVVARLVFTDLERYRRYQAGFGAAFAGSNGTLLAADEAPLRLEGEQDADKIVLMAFPTQDDAQAFLESRSYQEIAEDRKAGARSEAFLVQGLT